MQDIVGQVLGVTGTPVRNGSGVKYDVSFSDGQSYSTFKQPLAAKAQALQGQMASARIDSKLSADGQRTFYNLEDIAPQGQLPALAMPLAVGTPIGAPGQAVANGPVSFAPQAIPQVNPVEKDLRITRGNAANAVATLFACSGPTVEEYLEAVDKVARYIYTGRTGNEPVETAPVTPQELASALPGLQLGVEGIQAPAGTPAPTVAWS